MTALRVDGLRFRYPDGTLALEAVDLAVEAGEVVGLLGPNGSGKTTLLRTVARAALHANGSVRIAPEGSGPPALALDRPVFREWLSGSANLEALLRFRGISANRARRRAAAGIEEFGLSDVSGRPVGSYSRGMAHRLELALAFASGTGVILLDEPLAGLDPSARERFVEALGTARARRAAILLSTHEPDFAARVCDRVGFLAAGRLVALEPPADLLARISGDTRLVIGVRGGSPPDPEDLGPPPEGISAAEPGPDGLVLVAREASAALPAGLAWLLARGVEIETVEVREPGLRDAYFALTGERLGPPADRRG